MQSYSSILGGLRFPRSLAETLATINVVFGTYKGRTKGFWVTGYLAHQGFKNGY